ncbi:MAG: hypothetical protein ACOCV1_03135 [Bacillota bacterium]
MIDYDNSIFKEVWDYELERDLEKRSVFSNFLSTGKFYDDINGIIYYMKDGKYHREDGPAYIHKKSFAHLEHFTWYNNGKVHRIDGPAIRFFSKNNNGKQFWVFGSLLSEENFLNIGDLGNGNELVIL